MKETILHRFEFLREPHSIVKREYEGCRDEFALVVDCEGYTCFFCTEEFSVAHAEAIIRTLGAERQLGIEIGRRQKARQIRLALEEGK